jgi:predicted MPP superfamily phosphohydrolase
MQMTWYQILGMIFALLSSFAIILIYPIFWIKKFLLTKASPKTLKLVFLAHTFLIFAGFLFRSISNTLGEYAVLFSFYWLGLVWIFIGLSSIHYMTYGFSVKPFKALGVQNWLKNYGAKAVPIFTLLLLIWGFFEMGSKPGLTELKLRTPGINSPIKIIHLTDIHLTTYQGFERLRKTIELSNAQNPDLVVLTGDVVDSKNLDAKASAEAFKLIQSKMGVWAVNGNHEYYNGIQLYREISELAGIRLLENNAVLIEDTTLNKALILSGINDRTAERFGEKGEGLAQAMAVVNKIKTNHKYQDLPVVHLNHQPRLFEEAADAGIFLQLSGHTHGGQIFPFQIFVKMVFPYFTGYYSYKKAHIYVTRGTGTWGPPLRVGAPPEMTLIHLIP